MRRNIFDISFERNGQAHTGWVNALDNVEAGRKPSTFHVVLDGLPFGYLFFNDCKWTINQEQPPYLTEAVGKEIEKHYQL